MCALYHHMTHFSSVSCEEAFSSTLLIIPMKRSSPSFIKIKSATIKTLAITKGIIIDFSALLLFIKWVKNTLQDVFAAIRHDSGGLKTLSVRKYLLKCPWVTHGVSKGCCFVDCDLGSSCGWMMDGRMEIMSHTISLYLSKLFLKLSHLCPLVLCIFTI